ncbi:MAG: sigma factor-like helix-turn-helix DNA-binding protein [Patescibacteria group bacterium]
MGNKNVNISKIVGNLLAPLDARQKEVIEGRYGLKDSAVSTLAEIGDKYGVTRERIRQIEAGALLTVKNIFNKSEAGDFVNLVKEHLNNVGGLRRELLLLADLRLMVADASVPYLDNKVRFILDIAGEPKLVLEDDGIYSYWFLNEDSRKKAVNLITKLAKSMEGSRDNIVSHQNVDSLFNENVNPHNLKDLVAINYISISKKFHVNEYGDFGLSHWPEVNPRTVRDWSYIVLKKNQKPLHFSEIAESINKQRKNFKRLAHPQTVHNELIKDDRFVLVGRGTYGLREFGIMPGTAREVIGRLLKDHGPLKPKDLLELVLKERMFKKNTIFINLQNRKHFKRMEDGRYTTLV